MPRRCTVCAHPEVEAINRALVGGAPYRSVANRYESLSQAAVQRHQENHIPAALPAYEGGMVTVGEAASEARKQSEIV